MWIRHPLQERRRLGLKQAIIRAFFQATLVGDDPPGPSASILTNAGLQDLTRLHRGSHAYVCILRSEDPGRQSMQGRLSSLKRLNPSSQGYTANRCAYIVLGWSRHQLPCSSRLVATFTFALTTSITVLGEELPIDRGCEVKAFSGLYNSLARSISTNTHPIIL